MKLQSVNPYTEQVMKEFDYISVDEAIRITKSLKENHEWPDSDINDKTDAINIRRQQLLID